MTLLEVKNLRKSFGPLVVLDDISFSVPENSVTTFIGSSGSGKSSIVSLIERFYDLNIGISLL